MDQSRIARLLLLTIGYCAWTSLAAGQAAFSEQAPLSEKTPALTAPAISGQSHFALRDGLRIHLWQKCQSGQEARAALADKVAILVHGATWSGRPDFDLQIRDYSLMDHLARHGYDVWAIDIHGYGLSDKTDKDWSDTASAALDLEAAVEYVCALREVTQVKLLGWSWGTQIAGIYAARHPERIARLVLYGTVWRGMPQWKNTPLPDTQYRINTAESARSGFIDGQFEPDVLEAYVQAALQADPRSPNGTVIDVASKLPLIDPEAIRVPTLVLRPEKDFASTPEEMLEFFRRLKSPDKSYVVLPEGGHAIILEKGYKRFQEVVRGFFDRP